MIIKILVAQKDQFPNWVKSYTIKMKAYIKNKFPFFLGDNDLILDILKQEYREETINCISEVFITGEPLSVILDVNQEIYNEFSEILVNKAIKDGMSFVVINKRNNKVVGFYIGEDYFNTLPSEAFDHLHRNFRPLIKILGDLDQLYRDQSEVKSGLTYHILAAGLNKKLISYLNKKDLKILKKTAFTAFLGFAKSLGFQKAIAHYSNIASQTIGHAFGFIEISRINYDDFIFEDKKVFSEIRRTRGCIIMEKALN